MMQAENESSPRSGILRQILETLLYLAIVVGGVLLIGWLRGWSSPVQWSDGFFMASVLCAIVAIASRMILAFSAMRTRRISADIQERQEAINDLRIAESFALKLLVVAGICFIAAVVISH
jgi:hypothetical protein